MPIRLQENNISIHSSFWNALTNNSDSLALSQLWVCGIDKDQLTNIARQLIVQLPDYEYGNWSNLTKESKSVFAALLQDKNWTGSTTSSTNLYLFANGVSFIADGLNTSRVGASQTGAMKGLISDGRLDLNATNINFLETNISFVDGLLRPWMALVGHRSLKDQNLRCDIELFCLEKWELMQPLRVRKSMRFKNAVPINVDAVELNYTGDKLIERSVQFAFDRYEMGIYPDTTDASITTVQFALNSDTPIANPTPVPSINESIQQGSEVPLADLNANESNRSPHPHDRSRAYLSNRSPHPKIKPNSNESNVSPIPTSGSNSNESNISPIPTSGSNSNESNISPIPSPDTNIYEPNLSPVPNVNMNEPEGQSITSFEDGDMNLLDYPPNVSPSPIVELNINENNTSIIPSADQNSNKNNTSIIPSANQNSNKDNISIVPVSDQNAYKLNASPIPETNQNAYKNNESPRVVANILSTGR